MDTQKHAAVDESNLICLPTELLHEIVNGLFTVQLLPDSKDEDAYRSLRALRLTHRKFADYDHLNAYLFGNIYLEPTRACLNSIQRADFSRVAQYVHSVTFTTPPSWALSFKTYERIIHNSEETSARPSPEVLPIAYDAYMRDARDTQTLLESPNSELKQAWKRVLKTLGNRLEKITLLSHECEVTRRVEYLDTPITLKPDVPWQLPRHNHKDNWSGNVMCQASDDGVEYLCKHSTAVAGDKLLAAVISCLAASGVAIAHLVIQIFMEGDLECKDISGWERLDFSKLKKLRISPEMPSGENDLVRRAPFGDVDSRPELMKLKAGGVFHDLVEKCHSSIQSLSFGGKWGGTGVIAWPTRRPTYDFPELRHFALTKNIAPGPLSLWVHHLRNLRHLSLAGCISRGPSYLDWRYVFDAIADHPNVSGPNPLGLEVEFNDLDIGPHSWASYRGIICSDSVIATKRHERDTGPEYWRDVNYALETHFYNEVPFWKNIPLRYHMDEWDPEDSDSE
ncbi:hypothetical protein F53441_8168 [Fusarium austroafricanum]|uniref:Uncharacterized protein n=1 Tax=Fusarium austroafricanum TaxID=2364996 RepID=A0A8H4KET5_9HYPO|nr:hypothetical protein F53441_8168 [Fusarium austroafricanum]